MLGVEGNQGVTKRLQAKVASVTFQCKRARVLSCFWLFYDWGTVAHQAPRPWDFPGKNTGVGCQRMGSFSRESSQPKDQTHVFCNSCTGRQILFHWRHLGSQNSSRRERIHPYLPSPPTLPCCLKQECENQLSRTLWIRTNHTQILI